MGVTVPWNAVKITSFANTTMNFWISSPSRSRIHMRLLVVENQIGNLTPEFSFGHNLCFKYSNGTFETIFDIYVPRTFQWYKEFFNPTSFDP
jgi:hypothetical protein